MKNPFRTFLTASAKAQKKQLSAALKLQRMVLAPRGKRKSPSRAKSAAGPVPTKPTRRVSRPAPGTFVGGDFSSPHGKLTYKLYTPQGSSRRRLPLLVMLHGCTQSAAGFATSTGMNKLADEFGFLVLYPQQSATANPNRCWNWHSPADQKRGSGEPAKIAALTRYVLGTCRGNPARVYIAGISAGGAAAAIIAAAYPELYVAVGVHSGVARGDITTLRGALSAMRNGATATAKGAATPAPTIVFHGDQDRIVNPSNAGGFLANLLRSGAGAITGRTEKGRTRGGRDFTRTVYRQGRGKVLLEDWTVHGSGHAWSGGNAAGSLTDPAGPDASREMVRFFLALKQIQTGVVAK